MNTNFKAGLYSAKTEEFFNKLCALYNKYEAESDLKELSSKYDKLSKEENILVAFVGQYSSGKSTIIKALTGEEDILIDADIATSAVTHYKWGPSIHLVDTPGLKTGEREEHDIMTAEAIEQSDLLVYCITCDLFSEITTKDFKKLAEKYHEKLFLIINKMNCESGYYSDLVENYSNSINKTLEPDYSLAEFDHFFIDAQDYIKGITDKHQDYIDDSYFNEFIKKLNEFIDLKGHKGKLLTPINAIIDTIDNTLIRLEKDEHIKEGKTLIKKISDVVEEKKNAFIKKSNEDLQNTVNRIVKQGNEIARNLGEKETEFNDDAFQKFMDPLESELQNNIQKYFEQYGNEVDTKVKEILDTEMAKHFFEEQKRRLDKSYSVKKGAIDNLANVKTEVEQAATFASTKIGAWLSKAANVSPGKSISIWTVNGSDLHKAVKKIGHLFGHKFKPFQALKITKKIAKIMDKLGPLLIGVGVIIEGLMWIIDKIGEKKLKKIKEDIKELFKEVSEEVLKDYNKQINEAAKEIDDIKNNLEGEILKYEEEEARNNDFQKQLISTKKGLLELKKAIAE